MMFLVLHITDTAGQYLDWDLNTVQQVTAFVNGYWAMVNATEPALYKGQTYDPAIYVSPPRP